MTRRLLLLAGLLALLLLLLLLLLGLLLTLGLLLWGDRTDVDGRVHDDQLGADHSVGLEPGSAGVELDAEVVAVLIAEHVGCDVADSAELGSKGGAHDPRGVADGQAVDLDFDGRGFGEGDGRRDREAHVLDDHTGSDDGLDSRLGLEPKHEGVTPGS